MRSIWSLKDFHSAPGEAPSICTAWARADHIRILKVGFCHRFCWSSSQANDQTGQRTLTQQQTRKLLSTAPAKLPNVLSSTHFCICQGLPSLRTCCFTPSVPTRSVHRWHDRLRAGKAGESAPRWNTLAQLARLKNVEAPYTPVL